MPDEDAVNITRHKKILEDIRNGSEDDGRSGISDRHVEGRDDGDRQDARTAIGSDQGTSGGTQGASQSNGAPAGLREGVRPPQPKNVNAAARARQRKPKESSGVEEKKPSQFHFPTLGQKKKAPVKLFSHDEVESELERMAQIYKFIYTLPDLALEIGVKDHEPVEIWEINDEQAETLAGNHLRDAQSDPERARSARAYLRAYSRWYELSIVAPRAMKTVQHVNVHKGFSFK